MKDQKYLKQNYYLNKRANVKKQRRFKNTKRLLFILAILTSFVIMLILYLSSADSKIFMINITGNKYFNDEHYLKLSKLSDKDYYLFTPAALIEYRISKDPMVERVKVRHEANNLIKIDIKEKQVIAYTYEKTPMAYMIDGSKTKIDNEHLDIIASVPYLDGYNDNDIKVILRGFKKLDAEIIAEISEIHRYPFSYDEMMMEVIMRDGHFVYLSYYAIDLLNNYYDIVGNIKDESSSCIFFDEMTNSAYTSTCPFNDKEDAKVEKKD